MKVAYIFDKPKNCGACNVVSVCPVVWKYDFESLFDIYDNDVIGVDTDGVCEDCPLKPLPETEAIPIDWMMKWPDGETFSNGWIWNDTGYQVIRAMVEDWRKENG